MTQDPNQPPASKVAEDDLIIVPKERSRTSYLLVLGLMLFVLVIFTVGDQVQQVLGGGGGRMGGTETFVVWQDPLTGERHETSLIEFQRQKQNLALLASTRLWSPADPDATRPRVEDEDVVLFQVMDALAADSGMATSDEEYLGTLRAFGFTDELVTALARQNGKDAREVAAILRSGLRPTKMLGRILGSGAAYADPEAVVDTWKEDNPEYAFQYIELKRADYVEQAKANAPADEELQAWLDEQPPFAQQRYQTEVQVRAEVAWLPLGAEFDGSTLLAKYPVAEGTDPAARAELYYNAARMTRFRFPQEETEDQGVQDEDAPAQDADAQDADAQDAESQDAESQDAGEAAGDADAGDASPDGEAPAASEDSTEDAQGATDEAADDTPEEKPVQPTKFYYDLAEVQDQATSEAALWDAMTALLTDVRERAQAAAEGEEIDWLAEAAALGLSTEAMEAAQERSALYEVEGWGGRSLANQLTFQTAGSFLPRAQIEEGGIVLARLVEKIDPVRKPWEEIREEVLEEWATQQAVDIAVDSLRGILELCAEREAGEDGELVPFEQWTPIVEAGKLREQADLASFMVVERPFRGQNEWPNDDPAQALAIDRFLRGQPDLFELEVGAVGYPRKDMSGDNAYLVRLKDKREADPKTKLKAQAVLTLRDTLRAEAAQDLRRALYPGSDWFKRTFKVEWVGRQEDEAPAEETAPAADSE
ncbi:MAG: hypothetical protein ISQ08_00180 [Planctomycetes bacterium]|nr:hypothetical protein [Planctomycetota bacterium]